jgi:acetate kinase
MTAQSGLPHNHRVGDFDLFALPLLLKRGLSLEEILRRLAHEGGLLGMSGVSEDLRDIERAAESGNSRARLAIAAFVDAVRHYLGAYLVVLGGCDALVFTGGIGENSSVVRQAVCHDLGWAGIELDPHKNHVRAVEEKISSVESKADIWVVPANEELIVARQTVAVLTEMAS